MKVICLGVLILLTFFTASFAKENTSLPTTITVGKETYEDVRWGDVSSSTVTIFHKSGIARIPLANLPPNLQQHFGYNPAKAATQRAQELATQEQLQKSEREAAARRREQQEAKAREVAAQRAQKLAVREQERMAAEIARGYSGDFSFEGFAVVESNKVFEGVSLPTQMYLNKGTVINKTNRDWNNARFTVRIFDKAGKELKALVDSLHAIHVSALQRGQSQETKDGKWLQFPYEIEEALHDGRITIGRSEIEFIGGEFAAYYSFLMTSPVESKDLTFADDSIAAKFGLARERLSFGITNKSGAPMKIDWNQVSYVDTDGKTQKVIHEGVKYAESGQVQPVTLVPPGAFINDILVPVGVLHHTPGITVSGLDFAPNWNVSPLFPAGKEAVAYKGASFSVFMPLEINGQMKNYNFTFKITDVTY